MIRARLNPASNVEIQPKAVVGVLLPLPLAGAYDYKLPPGVNVPRGTVVAAPLGNREVLGVVWGKAEGTVGDNRLKEAVPLDGGPRLPEKLCDFIDWVADYTLNPPGAILAMALSIASSTAVHVRSTAFVGAQSGDLNAQIDVLTTGRTPDYAVILVGANDVTHFVPRALAARQLETQLARLVDAGTAVVVGGMAMTASAPDSSAARP